ncbi:MAG: type II secretion system protein GspL [Pseudomonadota bacterium]
MRKLILYLEKSDLSQLSWILTNEQGAPEQIILHGQLSELAAVAAANQSAQIIAIAPPEDVLLITAKLPKMSRHRLLQALPFAIEEQLLAEVEDLHFAIGEYDVVGLPVAIITKTKLRGWLDALKEIGLQPSIITPAPLTLPLNDQQWHIKIFGDSAILRTGQYSGFACDKHNLAVLLELKLAEQTEQPTAITIVNYSTDDFPQATQHAAEKDFMLALANLPEKNTLNLLQGVFQPKRTATYGKKIWRLTAYLAGAWLAIVLCCDFVSLMMLHHQETKLQTAINTIYKHNFPAATSVVAPKARMTDKLNNLTNENHKNRLLAWLAYLAKSETQVKAIKFKQLDYRNNQLSLEFTAPSLASIDTLTQALIQQGLQVKQQNVAAAGAGATGTLIISDGNS